MRCVKGSIPAARCRHHRPPFCHTSTRSRICLTIHRLVIESTKARSVCEVTEGSCVANHVQGDLFTPVENRRSFERVSEQIKEAIVDGRLKPGDRLPPETELAARLHVSRQTVREALRMLEHAGLLETPKRGNGGGTVIRNAIPATISGLFVDALRLNSISVDELNEARASVEQVILKFAIERANEEDIRLLSENIAESRRLVEAGVEASENDIEFHRLLAQCSKNRVIELVADALLCGLRSVLARTPPTVQMSVESVSRHEAVLAALKRRDPEAANSQMLHHLNTILDDLRQATGGV
jgi:GntR family transcriptional regulator, transcriptional repressor for pyruvate dehydrogenase complex